MDEAWAGSSPLTRGKRTQSLVSLPSCGLIPAHAGKTALVGGRSEDAKAHPRSRGENVACLDARHDRGRLIPAHAGKTQVSCAGVRTGWAHPRSRGENTAPDKQVTPETGSSPLTRGKRVQWYRADRRRGLIPAHAGKTGRTPAGTRTTWAHPRSRGENAVLRGWGDVAEGSSPLTRGKLSRGQHTQPVRGLIPAHAGKTSASGTGMGGPRAHPRSRGENAVARNKVTNNIGSSPLTRGKRIIVFRFRFRLGLIPAHAGKTPGVAHGSTSGSGSSPLTRGKRNHPRLHQARHGLIPAHAGKTWWSCEPSLHVGAHPRSRGENSATASVVSLTQGSSPLTRGKRRRVDRRRASRGLIPAHAGKTVRQTCV